MAQNFRSKRLGSFCFLYVAVELAINRFIRFLQLDNKTDNFNNNRIGFAKRLAKMIKRQNKYILVLTRKTLNSQWSKWELGIAHTLKFKKDELAIFPVVREEDIYLQWEFHNIYPHIVFTNKAGIELDDIKSILNCFQVIYPQWKGTMPMRMSLQKWLLK